MLLRTANNVHPDLKITNTVINDGFSVSDLMLKGRKAADVFAYYGGRDVLIDFTPTGSGALMEKCGELTFLQVWAKDQLAVLTAKQQEIITDQIINNDSATDEEMIAFLCDRCISTSTAKAIVCEERPQAFINPMHSIDFSKYANK